MSGILALIDLDVPIFSNVSGRPLDLPEYAPVFARLAEHRLPS